MQTVLGIDLGTQSLKCVFYDFEHQVIERVVSSPLEVDRDRAGKAEQLAEWWLTAMDDCMAQVEPAIRKSVKAIAVSGQQHGFVPLGAGGEVLAPVKLWCDTATQPQVDAITAAIGGKAAAIAATGNPVLAGYTAPKIRWLKEHLPDAYRQLAHILLPHDYLNYVLTGELAMEYGDASGTGLLDVRSRRWSAPMLAAIDSDRDLRVCLPPLLEADATVGNTSNAAAERFGLPAGIPVATGGGDNMMGAVGTGNVVPGKLTISLGSSGTLYASADAPVIDPEGTIAAFCSSTGGWLPLLCTMNCTLSTELIREPLAISLAEFDGLAASVAPGADGLVMLPFFNGERTPDLPHASASMHGLNGHNCTRAHMLRATIEGTSFALKAGLDSLSDLGISATEIILTGGGAKSALWRQVIADLFRLPVVMPKGEEGACFGAALQALWLLQRQQGDAVTIATVCSAHLQTDDARSTHPDEQRAAQNEAAYARYQRVLAHMTPLLREPLL